MTKPNKAHVGNSWMGFQLKTAVGDTVRVSLQVKFVGAAPDCGSNANRDYGLKKHKSSGVATDCSWMKDCAADTWCAVSREWVVDQPDPSEMIIFILDRRVTGEFILGPFSRRIFSLS